ncbi:Inosine/uridine-preferring nucleoside hydrolase domain-containing protein [Phycomyces nitens]|nr:Inosine/uridine-preferring nucleoside hydrolase domain-containing protein [Phycomyces nitens]
MASSTTGKETVIIDTDPGIDDALAIIMSLLSPELDVRAITLTHGNTSLEMIKRNAVTILNVVAEHRAFLGLPTNQVPVLAIGCASQIVKGQPCVTATHFHGKDGLGEIYDNNLFQAPADWESQLLHTAKNATEEAFNKAPTAFKTTPRDAADEILFQLKNEPPLTVTICAVGPLSNIALALQRDPVVFSRAKRIIVMGGAIDVPGNVTPCAEFNFGADPQAADNLMSSTKGFKHSPEGYRSRLDLINSGKVAPSHVVVVPLDPGESGTISRQDYEEYILPLASKTPVATFCNSFLIWTFEICSKLYGLNTLSIFDAYTMLAAIDMMHDKGDKQGHDYYDAFWEYKYIDLRIETTGLYTQGMSCYDRRLLLDVSWGDVANNVQVMMRGNGKRFNHFFLNRVFNAGLTL